LFGIESRRLKMTTELSPPSWAVARKQLAAMGAVLLLCTLVSIAFYLNDRRQEWRLRQEQATHQLELAFQLIDRDIERVRADVTMVANLAVSREFESDNELSRSNVEYEFKSFLQSKKTFQQIRLLDLSGQEAIRVDWRDGSPKVVAKSDLQNKNDRYYVRESLGLKQGEVFVSQFDLNQEHGRVEQPLCPVIRFITPVTSRNGESKFLLVANYMGAPLLKSLISTAPPSRVFLVRGDGHYLLGPSSDEAWGWLLGHSNSFDRRFRDAWTKRRSSESKCFLNSNGAFAFRSIRLHQFGAVPKPSAINSNQISSESLGNALWVVSYLPPAQVFRASRQLLNRLIFLLAIISLPLFLLTRYWAYSSVRRVQQNNLIQQSERKLRELSARLVRIQEEARKSISREIHDQLGQQATAINLELKLAAKDVKSENVSEQINRAIRDSEQLLTTLHDFASRIRPVELDDLGLSEAIESLLGSLQNRTGIDFHFSSDINEDQIPANISENVFRLVQESLNNVLKHAQATRVEVSIKEIGDLQDRRLNLNVADDGVGVSRSSEQAETQIKGSQRLGILGMQERVDLMGGTFQWESTHGKGTMVNVVIPLEHWLSETENREQN